MIAALRLFLSMGLVVADMFYLCSGYMINRCFDTQHNNDEDLFILAPDRFYTIEEFNERFTE